LSDLEDTWMGMINMMPQMVDILAQPASLGKVRQSVSMPLASEFRTDVYAWGLRDAPFVVTLSLLLKGTWSVPGLM